MEITEIYIDAYKLSKADRLKLYNTVRPVGFNRYVGYTVTYGWFTFSIEPIVKNEVDLEEFKKYHLKWLVKKHKASGSKIPFEKWIVEKRVKTFL